MRDENRPRRIARMIAAVIIAVGMALLAATHAVDAQTAPKKGAAERSEKGWPYPEPAQRGATGYSPNYQRYTDPSERWDIYANILWRKTGSRNKDEVEYYNYELSEFLDSLEATHRAKLKAAGHLLLVMRKIRWKAIKLPYRDTKTGCVLFLVDHNGRRDLAADKCDGGS